MPKFWMNAPFGDILLEIETSSATISVGDATSVQSTLPDGMRVDDCRLHSVSVDCAVGDEFSVQLGFEARDGWVADFASGEGLDAFDFEHSGEDVAALGMRDPEWLCDRFSLVYLETSHRWTDKRSYTARYKALSNANIQLQLAYAWTSKPKTEREADSPNFAVDLAMTF